MPANGKDAPFVRHLIAAALLLAAGLFLFSRLHDGHPMDEDFSVYLQEAVNIAHGRPVGEIGVIYAVDPKAEAGQQGPVSYPPLIPLLYAPFVGLLGVDLPAFKIVQLSLLLVTFGLLLFFRRRLGFSLLETGASLAVFCLLPETLWQINDIGSDLPFLFFLVVGLLTAEAQRDAPPQRRTVMAILLGVVTFLAFDARIVGVALLPAAALAHIVKYRRQTHPVSVLVPGATFAVLWLIQSLMLHQQSAYDVVFAYKFFAVITNLRYFYWYLLYPWSGTRMAPVASLVMLAAAALAGIGALGGVRRANVACCFCAVYFAMILVLPNLGAGIRYLVPVLLFFGALTARGAAMAASAITRDRRRIGAASAAASAVLVAVTWLAPPQAKTMPYGALTPPTSEVFAFLRARTDPGALVAVRKYRAFHLFTGRLTIRPTVAAQESAADLSRWAAANRIDYLVLKKSPALAGPDYSDCPASPLCSQMLPQARMVFGNADYQVFRLRPGPQP